MQYRCYPNIYRFLTTGALAVVLGACGGGSGGTGGDGTPTYADGLQFVEEHNVNNATELREALIDAESVSQTTVQGLVSPMNEEDDGAILIVLENDIGPESFESGGPLEYHGEADLYLLGGGDDYVTIDAGGHSRILDLPGSYAGYQTAPGAVHIEGIRFTGGDGSGSAVHRDGPLGVLFVYDSIFEDHGGRPILDNADKPLTVIDSEFRNNPGAIRAKERVDNNGLTPVDDDFVYGMTIIGSTFENNVTGNGGAILYGEDSLADGNELFEIRDSEFIGNEAKLGADNRFGGALHTTQGGIIEDSEFANNAGNRGAGAIYVTESRDEILVVDNTVFFGNETLGDATLNHGGAIMVLSDDDAPSNAVVVENSLFEENFAHNDGGAIYADEDIITLDSDYVNNEGTPIIYSEDGSAGGSGNTFTGNPDPL